MTGEAPARPLSRAPWLAAQTWEDLLLAHWPVDLERLRAAVPAPLPIDTFAGQAWVSVVPLTIRGSRLRLTPPPPLVGAFPEVNLRTYGTVGGRPGIVFLSLDADNPLFVALVRALYRLPYLHARIRMRRRGATVEVQGRRTDGRAPAASFAASYRAVGDAAPAAPGSLEHWLVERYCAYTADRRGRLLRVRIDHPPWLLQPGEATLRVNELGAAFGLDLSGGPALLHVVRRTPAVFWAPARVRPAEMG
jgi:uncharacterized protein YqjF (DUF2071 family)